MAATHKGIERKESKFTNHGFTRKREGEDCLKFSIAQTLSHGFNIKERQQIYNATAKIGQPNKAK